jgi:hypothetical protein
VEIKHGRICQLAFLGQITTRAFDSFPNGVTAFIGPDSIPTAGFVQLVSFIGVLECTFMRDVEGTGNEFVALFAFQGRGPAAPHARHVRPPRQPQVRAEEHLRRGPCGGGCGGGESGDRHAGVEDSVVLYPD